MAPPGPPGSSPSLEGPYTAYYPPLPNTLLLVSSKSRHGFMDRLSTKRT